MPKLNISNGQMKHRAPAKKGTMKRLINYLFKFYKGRLILVFVFLIIAAISGTTVGIFLREIIDNLVDPTLKGTMTKAEFNVSITRMGFIVGSVFLTSIICTTTYTQIMAVVTQGFLRKLRIEVFNKMQDLPIKYFDTHTHGDIMSIYTNDIDSVRQLVSQSLPSILQSTVTVIFLIFTMLTFSVWLTLIVFFVVFLILFIVKTIGGKSGKYFKQQQRSLGIEEGYIEEMMNGQKVVKAFCFEDTSIEKFDKINDQLCDDATKANTFANILMPLLMNLGNFLYVVLAFVGGLLAILKVPNLTLIGITSSISLGTLVAFLPMSKNFTQNISQTSQQINAIVMALAGADRIFTLLDEKSEVDDGYVTLVNCIVDGEKIVETNERTDHWAWRHPHTDGTITYTLLQGDIVFNEVDFGYDPEKIVLHDVSIYARPGEKIAFVGATGAGKTTITNLLNRFYDLADGKIKYDGININKIKKDDLRRSLGIVLQDTNLFTGTLMENIRYGRLDATDEEVIEAAKLANAHDFITRLPDGYNTMLTSDGANLSQGQRQLISIARAAVADAPVMILDEATSSIDTRTEILVQKGTDQLMHGRTVFVIAHRLSTIHNSDVIMVLEKGRIIERGNHEKLMKEKGQYYKLYTGGFELD